MLTELVICIGMTLGVCDHLVIKHFPTEARCIAASVGDFSERNLIYAYCREPKQSGQGKSESVKP